MTAAPLPPIQIEIPTLDEGGEAVDLVAFFNEQVHDTEDGELGGELLAALDLSVVDPDRTTVYEVTVEDVEQHEGHVVVHYNYDFTGYAACKDIDLNGNAGGSAVGVRTGTTWEFDRHVYPERLYPNEEF